MNNKFWREVFDQIHSLVMVFRMDPAGPQLMFVNQAVGRLLGYQPESYVMESEQPGALRTELEKVYYEVQAGAREVTLKGLDGSTTPFAAGVSVFESAAVKAELVALTLEPLEMKRAADSAQAARNLVAESTVMQSVLQRVEFLDGQQGNMVFVGEGGTGKRFFMDRIRAGLVTEGRSLWMADYEEGAHRADGVQMDVETMLGLRQRRPVDVLIYGLHKMPKTDQQRFEGWMSAFSPGFRLVAGSEVSPDDLVAKGKLQGEFYYAMAANNVVLPPLQLRRADIRPYAEAWLGRVAAAMGATAVTYSDKEWDRLFHHEWKRHYDELNEILTRTLAAQSRKFLVAAPPAKSPAFPAEPSKDQAAPNLDVGMPYDEFMRGYLAAVLERCQGKVYGTDGAAALLGLRPTTLQSKLQKYGVK